MFIQEQYVDLQSLPVTWNISITWIDSSSNADSRNSRVNDIEMVSLFPARSYLPGFFCSGVSLISVLPLLISIGKGSVAVPE